MRAPFCIQTATYLGHKPGQKVSDTFQTHYMGSSEFEWGALPESLKRMAAAKDSGAFSVCSGQLEIFVWAAKLKDREEIAKHIFALIIASVSVFIWAVAP